MQTVQIYKIMSQEIKNLPREKWALVRFRKVKSNLIYYVSNLGRVKGKNRLTKRQTLIKGTKDNRGFLKLVARKERIETKYVHKEIAKNFVKKTSKTKTYVIHKDFNKSNNKASNLMWVDRKGLYKFLGKRNKALGFKKRPGGNIKLTPAKVRMIKKYLNNGKKSKVELAKKYGVSSTQLKRIERGENWSYVEARK